MIEWFWFYLNRKNSKAYSASIIEIFKYQIVYNDQNTNPVFDHQPKAAPAEQA